MGRNVESGVVQNSRDNDNVDDRIHIARDNKKDASAPNLTIEPAGRPISTQNAIPDIPEKGNPVCAVGECVPPLGESISTDFECFRMLLPDTIHQPARVGNFADEMAGGYINLCEDDMEGDFHAWGRKRYPR